jgi:hypothetical protein
VTSTPTAQNAETNSSEPGFCQLLQLSDVADADSESVEELVEEGNVFEAKAVEGVEDTKPPDVF